MDCHICHLSEESLYYQGVKVLKQLVFQAINFNGQFFKGTEDTTQQQNSWASKKESN